MLGWGDHAPWFSAAALSGSPTYKFDTVAGRHVLMLFYGSASHAPCRDALDRVAENRELFDDVNVAFFGITADPQDVKDGLIAQQIPGIRFFLDHDRKVSALYGAAEGDTYHPHWLLLDPALRVLGVFPLDKSDEAIERLRAALAEPAADSWAPVLLVPNVIEPELCARLIGGYEADGGEESGFMRDVEGKTVLIVDPHHKQRRDYFIEDEQLRRGLVARMRRRLSPALERAFQFKATRIERYLVACYAAGAGHFRRDVQDLVDVVDAHGHVLSALNRSTPRDIHVLRCGSAQQLEQRLGRGQAPLDAAGVSGEQEAAGVREGQPAQSASAGRRAKSSWKTG